MAVQRTNGLPKERHFLITGCARSGTSFITEFFTLNGLSVSHEGEGELGIVSWTMAVDTGYSPWGPASNKYQFRHVLHQVRDPLKTIASVMATEPLYSWVFIYKHIPEIKWQDPGIVQAAKYWYYWNLRAESKAEMTYRIEDLTQVIPKINELLGLETDPQIVHQISKTTNHRHQTPNLTWLHLHRALDKKLYANIVALAKRYGYDVSQARNLTTVRKMP